MKFKSVLAAIFAALMIVSLVACNKPADPAETTPASTTVASTPDETTATPSDVTTAAGEVTTKAPEQTTDAPTTEEQTEAPAPNSFGLLSDTELAAFKALLPVVLPDNTADYTFNRVMCLDQGLDNYIVEGNSGPRTEFVGVDGGAIYGEAAKLPAYGQSIDKRAEITLKTFNEITIAGAKGVMFYVDFSHVTVVEEGKLCASVTINTNDYRSTRGANETSTAYYWDGFNWIETHNINACRMLLPTGFCGWVYVPATSYWYNKGDKVDGVYPNCAADEKGLFTDEIPTDILSFNMRCYTDGYQYTDAADQYIIFDEILFIYG